MTYQPWGYDPTKKLYDLFQKKFGKVWKTIGFTSGDITVHSIVNHDDSFFLVENENISLDSIPVISLSAFCEFVDLVFVGNDGNDIYTHKLPQIMYETVSVAANYRREELYDSVNIHLKHFALDNWSEPEKVIEEVKKYL